VTLPDDPGSIHASRNGTRPVGEPTSRPARKEVSEPAGDPTAEPGTEGTPRVVLVHGFTQSASSWREITAQLEADGIDVLAWALPGHGGVRTVPADLDLPAAAELLGQAGGLATYVGYSLGARICLHLALLRPDLVQRLVLVGGTAGVEDLDARDERRGADDALAVELDEAGEEGLSEWIDRWLAGPMFAHLTPEQADRESRMVNSASGLAAALRHLGTGTQRPLWEELGTIEMPTLVIAGELDAKFTDLGMRMTQAIGAAATFVLVPGAGHAVPFEVPGPFANLVADFANAENQATGP
jgi:2-succinyl-6-hydroxy-2,4-cyclohexadiene-1-carboxylate synthase